MPQGRNRRFWPPRRSCQQPKLRATHMVRATRMELMILTQQTLLTILMEPRRLVPMIRICEAEHWWILMWISLRAMTDSAYTSRGLLSLHMVLKSMVVTLIPVEVAAVGQNDDRQDHRTRKFN